MITPIPNWHAVLTRAWSVRLMILAALFSGIETALSLLSADMLGLPPGIFAALASMATSAALIARFVAQKGVTPDVENQP